MKKVILTAAVTGSVTFPSQTPYLPITPEEIAADAYSAYENGASVVHVHVRDPETGKPSPSLDLFKEVLTKIKSQSDLIVCTTTGGGAGMTLEERLGVVPTFKPELASFNMGSMNFALFPIADKIEVFKTEWEKPMIEGTKDLVFKNTFTDLEYICKTMKENGTKPELEIYDAGMLYNTAFMARKGLLDFPIHMQFVTGVLGGTAANIYELVHLKQTADRLFGDKYTWSIIGVGYPTEFQLGAAGISLGGHVRVGLEDNIYLERGVLAKSSGELCAKMTRIIRDLGFDVATPAEAREMLGLKGLDKVNY